MRDRRRGAPAAAPASRRNRRSARGSSRRRRRRRVGLFVGSACLRLPVDERVEVVEAADDAAAQEADQQHEHEAQHELPGGAEPERRLQEVLQEQPDRGAEQRPEQRAGAADRGLHDQLARGVEGEGVGRHEGLQHAEQAAGETGIGRGNRRTR